MGEPTTPFLKVLALFETLCAIESVASWPLCRAASNLAAHDYQTNYERMAEHFNELHSLVTVPIQWAARVVALCEQSLAVGPAAADFETEFRTVCLAAGAP